MTCVVPPPLASLPVAACVVQTAERVPAEIRASVMEALQRVLPLVPTWCHSIALEWDNEQDGALSVRPEYEYRRAELIVGQAWLDEPEERATAMAHEVAHLYLAPYATTVEALAPTGERFDEVLRIAEESCVSDLAAMVLRAVAVP